MCESVKGDKSVLTVADDAQPIKCPFSDDVSYAFNYNDQTYGFCARSTSYLRPCVNHTRYQFHFHHCVALATFNRKGTVLCSHN